MATKIRENPKRFLSAKKKKRSRAGAWFVGHAASVMMRAV